MGGKAKITLEFNSLFQTRNYFKREEANEQKFIRHVE